MTIKICTALIAMLAVAGCSGMVAPTNEGGPTSTTKNAKTSTGTETGGDTTGGETTGGETTGGETTGGEEGGDEGGDEVKSIGTVSAETTDIASFAGKSGYLLVNDGGTTMLYLTTVETDERSFKKIVDYGECKKTETTTVEVQKSKYIAIMFSKAFTPDTEHKVDDNGFPKEDDNAIEDPVNSKAGILSATLTDSTAPTTPVKVKTGTIKFASGKRPSKAGDAFEVALDLTLEDGKKYKGTLASSAVKSPTDNATAPTCPEGESAAPVYEE